MSNVRPQSLLSKTDPRKRTSGGQAGLQPWQSGCSGPAEVLDSIWANGRHDLEPGVETSVSPGKTLPGAPFSRPSWTAVGRSKAMSTPFIVAVMVHVPSISEALAWYEQVFPNAQRSSIAEEEFEFLLVGEVRLELVLADQKVSSGPSRPLKYRFPILAC